MNYRKLYILSIVAIGLIIMGSGCATSQPTIQPTTQPSNNNNNTVAIANFSFQPTNLDVKAGTTIIWTNNDSAPHTITADNGSFDSGNIPPGGTFSHTFATIESIAYHCTFHSSMHGKINITQ